MITDLSSSRLSMTGEDLSCNPETLLRAYTDGYLYKHKIIQNVHIHVHSQRFWLDTSSRYDKPGHEVCSVITKFYTVRE